MVITVIEEYEEQTRENEVCSPSTEKMSAISASASASN